MDRKKIITKLFSLLFLLSLQVSADPTGSGLDAYKRGEKIAAKQHWLPLANNNNAKAQFYLSILYEEGLGGKEDNRLSLQWLKRASEGGYAPAQFNLGNLYIHGERIVQSDKWAAHWWQKAAQQGVLGAQFNLAKLYVVGRGVKKDLEVARFWYGKAAAQGSDQALLALREMDGEESVEGGGIESQQVVSAKAGSLVTQRDSEQQTVTTRTSGTQNSAKASSLTPGSDGEHLTVATETSSMQNSAVTGSMQVSAETPGLRDSRKSAAAKEAPQTKQKAKSPIPLSSLGSDSMALAGRLWVMNQLPSHATIQLYASGRKESCEKQRGVYLSQYKLEAKIYNYRVKGNNYCALLYESFPSLAVARGSVERLPDGVRANKPWVRSFNSLQQKVR